MSRVRLQLYTREGCHLCDELLVAAAPILQRYDAAVERVDIDADPSLRRRYDLSIPVLALDGREICRHRLDAAALEQALRSVNAGVES